MTFFLPHFIFLKSNKRDKYLRYRKETDTNHAFLEFSQDEKAEKVEIQYVKFEVRKSETLEGFVHIRTCYNNKYWVRKYGGDESKSSWIAAEANEPEEDQSKLSCTLFKPVLVDADVDQEADKPHKIRLVHVDQVGKQGCVALVDSDLLTLQDEEVEGDDDIFTAYDAASIVMLPPRVAFKNHEGKYGAVTTVNGVTYVEFNTTDIGAVGVAIEPFQEPLVQPDPYMLCRHISYGYWRLPDNNVVRVSESSGGLPTFAVTPIRLTGNNIALRNYDDRGRFANCGEWTSIGLDHILGCTATSINQYAIFGVEEPVLRREVSNVVYNLADARVYNVGSMDKYRDVRRNYSGVEQTGSFGVSFTKSQTKTWGHSASIGTTVTASLSVSIPYVGIDLGIELSEEQSQTVEFGKEETEEENEAYSQNLTIPPGKKITLLVTATRAQCDVPFTCSVVDTLSNGTIVEYTKTDGLFTGANEFSFTTDILQEDL